MNNHTPGPWSTDVHVIRGHKNIVIAKTIDSKEAYETKQANAALIAAAPALLEALQEIAQYPLNVDGYNSVAAVRLRYTAIQTIARKAIDQAEGSTP